MMMRIILRFSTKNLTTCQGKNFRQNLVALVGEGGKEISFGPWEMCFSCMLFYSGIKNQKGFAFALYKKR